MSTTTYLDLPLLAAAQAQKHVTVNEALLTLDAYLGAAVSGRGRVTPPGAPVVGEAWYLRDVPALETAWEGEQGKIAVAVDATGLNWRFLPPVTGQIMTVADEGLLLAWDGSRWLAPMQRSYLRQDLTLTGAFVAATLAIPANSLVYAVRSRVLTGITGAAAYSVGHSADTGRFGVDLPGGVDNVWPGGRAPIWYATADDRVIRVTGRNGSGGTANFTGGAVATEVIYEIIPVIDA
jgi:hypothetical protein